MTNLGLIPVTILLCLLVSCAVDTRTLMAAGEGPEKEIFIHVHSGITTIPVRKVIGLVIQRAEGRGVDAITGSGLRRNDGTWSLELSFLDKEKEVERSFKWRYSRDTWELIPLNVHAEQLSFPLDKYVFGPAINMGFGMLEEQEVSPQEVNGRAKRLQDGRWHFNMIGLSDNGERFVQEWSYDSNEGVLHPTHFDHSDLDKLLGESITNGKVDLAVVKNTPHLKEFLKKIAKIKEEELEAFSKEEQKAFWINAYNAIMLKVMADNYPDMNTDSIADAMRKNKTKVAREKLTLSQIRDDILADTFEDERVRFALLSASKDSPGLRAEAYCGRVLENQLDEVARDFLSTLK